MLFTVSYTIYQLVFAIYIACTLPVIIRPNKKIHYIRTATFCLYFIPILILTITTGYDAKYVSKFYIFIVIFIQLMIYKDKFVNYIFSFFVVYFSLIICECAAVGFLVVLRGLIPALDLVPYFIFEKGNLNSLTVFIVASSICFAVANKIVIPSICGYTQFMNMGTAVLLSIPLLISLGLGNVFYSYTGTLRNYIMFSIEGLLFFVCNCALLCYGFNKLKKHNYKVLQNKYEKERLEALNGHAKLLQSKYNEVRKWNHDIANHLASLSYLLERDELQKADTYIEDLLAQFKEVSE